MVIATKAVKTEKAAGHPEVEMISASGEVRSYVMLKLCQRVLHAKEMQDELLNKLKQIFKEKKKCKKL